MAIPYPVKDSHLLFFASFAWRTPSRVKLRKSHNEHFSTAVPQKADVVLTAANGSFVPKNGSFVPKNEPARAGARCARRPERVTRRME